MVKPVVFNLIRQLANEEGIEGCFLISKRGRLLAKVGDLDSSMEESFGTLSATIFGAALQTNKILEKKLPKQVLIDDRQGSTVLRTVDKNHFLLVRTGRTEDKKSLLKTIKNTSWNICQEI